MQPQVEQWQVIQILEPLFEHLGIDIQNMSRVTFTASRLEIQHHPFTTIIDYTGGK